MTPEEFQHIVMQDSALAQPLQRAAAAMQPGRMGATELAAVALVFPVARFVLMHIGLPWLHEAARYSELWRTKFHAWIDGQYREHGLDPNRAESAGECLRDELEKTTEAKAHGAWERLVELFKQSEAE
jgi:hypothetical protein